MRSNKLLAIFILLVTPLFSFAVTTSSIQLPKYYQAQCGSYTGTWQGFFTDPTDLFGNGGPWPVTMSLYSKDKAIIGISKAPKAPSFVKSAITGQLWANCKDGQLSNIFLGKKNQCGSLSQTGLLISRNVLVLKLNYENAMTDAHFLLFLKRINNHYSGKIPLTEKAMRLPKITSCH